MPDLLSCDSSLLSIVNSNELRRPTFDFLNAVNLRMEAFVSAADPVQTANRRNPLASVNKSQTTCTIRRLTPRQIILLHSRRLHPAKKGAVRSRDGALFIVILPQRLITFNALLRVDSPVCRVRIVWRNLLPDRIGRICLHPAQSSLRMRTLRPGRLRP